MGFRFSPPPCVWVGLVLCVPEGRGEDGVGRLHRLSLRRDSREVALVQRGVEPSLQGRVHVGQGHQVLGLLEGGGAELCDVCIES